MPSPIQPTSIANLDRAVAELQAAKDRFAELTIPERVELLKDILRRARQCAGRAVAAALDAKRIDPTSPTAGEEWLAGPTVLHRNLRLLIESLEEIQSQGRPQLTPGSVSQRSDGQTVVRVFPGGLFDKALFTGFTADVWMEPGVTPQSLPDTMAKIYREKTPGKVALVLGAGNVASIGPMDVLYKMFVENQVCVLKMNPVNEYLGPFVEEAFAKAVEAGFLRVVYGGAEVGAHLCQHPGVEEIHITGSDKTHDAIVWGAPGPEREARKAKKDPLLKKPITSELGNVSPILVVPGPWTESDLQFHAENIASMLQNNASFNCNAAKLIVQQAGWSLREPLMARLEATLRRLPRRFAYYPGAPDRYAAFLKAHPNAREIGEHSGTQLPWTLIPGVDPANPQEICFTTEAFCSVLAETGLAAEGAADFLDKAADFCNERVWGTLNVTLLIHPKSEQDPAVGQALDRALSKLRYGTIVINHWAALGYGLVVTPWGAYPGHPLEDIQSGRGFVHNTKMFERVQKTVIRGPFRVQPRPPWFATSKKTHEIGKRLSEFEADPGFLKLPGIVLQAIQS